MCALPFICDVILAFSLITQVACSHLAYIYIYIYIYIFCSTLQLIEYFSNGAQLIFNFLILLLIFYLFIYLFYFFTLDFPQGIHNYLAIKLKSLVGVCWVGMAIQIRPADTRPGPILMGRILPDPIKNRVGYGFFLKNPKRVRIGSGFY